MLHTLVFIFAEVFGNESFIVFSTVFIKGIGRICTPPLCDFAAVVVIKKIIMENNRVCCLYRVSTDKQVDYDNNNEADIPMQRKACHRFADKMGWTIVHEEQEDGVSGHKIRAENRDKIQAIKELARKGKFDILLVFMFDRIGRIADETPFVVEWFVKNGIQVWSTQEGEQRFDNHIDKLNKLREEVVKSIQGESAFSQSMLAGLVEDSKKKSESLKVQCEKAESEVESSKTLIKDLNDQYDEIISWSSLYDSASIEAKKMIVNSMIKRVDVYRNYELNVELNMNIRQFFLGMEESKSIPFTA